LFIWKDSDCAVGAPSKKAKEKTERWRESDNIGYLVGARENDVQFLIPINTEFITAKQRFPIPLAYRHHRSIERYISYLLSFSDFNQYKQFMSNEESDASFLAFSHQVVIPETNRTSLSCPLSHQLDPYRNACTTVLHLFYRISV